MDEDGRLVEMEDSEAREQQQSSENADSKPPEMSRPDPVPHNLGEPEQDAPEQAKSDPTGTGESVPSEATGPSVEDAPGGVGAGGGDAAGEGTGSSGDTGGGASQGGGSTGDGGGASQGGGSGN